MFELQSIGSVLQFWVSFLIILPQIFSVTLSNHWHFSNCCYDTVISLSGGSSIFTKRFAEIMQYAFIILCHCHFCTICPVLFQMQTKMHTCYSAIRLRREPLSVKWWDNLNLNLEMCWIKSKWNLMRGLWGTK